MRIYLLRVYDLSKKGILEHQLLFDSICIKARSMPQARKKAVKLLAGLRNCVEENEYWYLDVTQRKEFAFRWSLEEVTPQVYSRNDFNHRTYAENLLSYMQRVENQISELQQERDFWQRQLDLLANPI